MYNINGYVKGECCKGFYSIYVIMAFAFLLNGLIFVASKVDFAFFKALVAPKPILTLFE